MSYNFVRHTKSRSRLNHAVVLHLTPPRLSLSVALRRKHDSQNHAYVELFHDDQARLLAFRFTDDATVPVAKITRTISNANVSCLSFVCKAKAFGYPMNTPLEVKEIEDGLLLILKGVA